MITCPQCGQSAADGTRFCERCGRQLLESDSGPTLPPLESGRELGHGYKIAEVLSQTSAENWYRAVQSEPQGSERRVLIRERLGPSTTDSVLPKQVVGEAPATPETDQEAKRVDPKAPTRELPPIAGAVAKPDATETTPTEVEAKPAAVEAKPAATEAKPEADEANNVEPAETGEPDSETVELSPAEAVQSEPQPGDEPSVPDEAPDAESAETVAAKDEGSAPQADAPAKTEAEPPDSAGTLASEAAVGAAAPTESGPSENLGELFGRVRDLSRTLTHPAFQRALDSFSNDGRVYLAYPDEALIKLSERPQGLKMSEPRALSVAIQVCQAVSFIHKRGFRMNDICPDSVAIAPDGRVKLTGLDWITNDNEIAADPLISDGYTAPEVYRGRRVDKRADIFSVACLLYTSLTGERLECETWLEESALVRFYPPHVVSPPLEKVVRRALAFRPEDRYPTIDEFKAELVKLNSTIRLRSASMTDVGMVRELNEDSILALEYFRDSLIEPAQSFLYVVSDGMGGAAAGEVASAIAVATIREYVEAALGKETAEKPSLAETAIGALEEANRKIIEYQKVHTEARGMGATGVIALVQPPKATVAWVGDSRGYLHDGVRLRQVTKDHSLVQRLVDIGQITPEQARHHEHKNVILRSLGARQSGAAGAEAVDLMLKRGDRLLLCSDGLMAHVEDGDISEIIGRHSEPADAARELIVAANAGGGTDNISVILVFAE